MFTSGAKRGFKKNSLQTVFYGYLRNMSQWLERINGLLFAVWTHSSEKKRRGSSEKYPSIRRVINVAEIFNA